MTIDKIIYLLFLLIIIVILGILKPYYYFKESLQDFGYRKIEMDNAPLAYENITLRLKNLQEDDELRDDSFNEILFNNNDYKQFYSSNEMNMDFKYFNNSSNLTLAIFFSKF